MFRFPCSAAAFDNIRLQQVAKQIQAWLQDLSAKMPAPVAFSIRPSARAKKLRLQVSAGKIEVVVPAAGAHLAILPFVQRHRLWLLQSLEKFGRSQSVLTLPARVGPGQTVSITFQGAAFPLTVQRAADRSSEGRASKPRRIKIEFDRGFTATVPAALPSSGCADAVRAELIKWFKKQTRIRAEQWVAHHGPACQLTPRSIVIRRQKSRWGSCGIHNDISLNWLLILAPPEILEYVVVHELCHIRIKNHSRQFWQLVARHLPDYRQSRRWLRQNGGALLAAWQNV